MEDIVKITSDNTKLIMQPYANWEEYLVPAPVSIAILGELVCISSNVDFSINKKPPTGGFLYIKYPDSSRACLMQVANSVSAAFNEAHRNMDQIRLNTGYMTAYIKTSMKVSLQENDELVQTLLPDHLEIIATISDECVELADQTERKFIFVSNLMLELIKAYVSTKGQSQAQLEMLRQKQKESLENLVKNQKELTEISNTLRNYEIDFEITIKILLKGLDAMGSVKEQCEKMVRFFQMVSNIVRFFRNKYLTDFVKKSQEASQKHLSYNRKKFTKDLIYQQAFVALNVASVVNMISGTYIEISDKHLKDLVSSLGKLMALDPSKSYLESERGKLNDACESAQQAIRDLVKNNKKKFDQEAKERMEKIVKELQPMLPPVSEEKMKEIKEITESVVIEVSQEDEDQYA